ncbi:MAG: hypothetical protein KME52_02705 [Desmonostoc geniculatum HA4340-LM1]|jgi:hypothetical protein|nr:hypothetical protein [Desmonostoc geniculatum HA4340-LM1]
MGASTLNGRKENKTPVLKEQLITDSETLEAVETAEAPVVTPNEQEVPAKRKKPKQITIVTTNCTNQVRSLVSS